MSEIAKTKAEIDEEIRVAKIKALKKERAAVNAKTKKELMVLGEDASKKRRPPIPPQTNTSCPQ